MGVVVELDPLLRETGTEMRQAGRRMVTLVGVADADRAEIDQVGAGRGLLISGAAHGQDLAGAHRTAVLTEIHRDRARDHTDVGGVHLHEHRTIGRATLDTGDGIGANGDDDPERPLIGGYASQDQITQLDIDRIKTGVTDGHIALAKRRTDVGDAKVDRRSHLSAEGNIVQEHILADLGDLEVSFAHHGGKLPAERILVGPRDSAEQETRAESRSRAGDFEDFPALGRLPKIVRPVDLS